MTSIAQIPASRKTPTTLGRKLLHAMCPGDVGKELSCRSDVYYNVGGHFVACGCCGWQCRLTQQQEWEVLGHMAGYAPLHICTYLAELAAQPVTQPPPAPALAWFPVAGTNKWAGPSATAIGVKHTVTVHSYKLITCNCPNLKGKCWHIALVRAAQPKTTTQELAASAMDLLFGGVAA